MSLLGHIYENSCLFQVFGRYKVQAFLPWPFQHIQETGKLLSYWRLNKKLLFEVVTFWHSPKSAAMAVNIHGELISFTDIYHQHL